MRLRRLLVLLAATLLLVSGCGGDNPEPRPMPKPSSTTSASSSPTPPAMPEAAKKKSKKGAIAFGRHYVDLINHAQATGDVRPLRAVEAASCDSCRKADSYIAKLYSSGGHIEGGEFTVKSASAFRNPTTSGWLLELGVTFAPQVVVHPSPTPAEHPKGGRMPLNIQVAWKRTSWQVLEWSRGA